MKVFRTMAGSVCARHSLVAHLAEALQYQPSGVD